MIGKRIWGALLAAVFAATPAAATDFTFVPFSNVSGWNQDSQRQALRVFSASCRSIRSTPEIPASDWQDVCARARSNFGSAQRFFERNFAPVRITHGNSVLFTAYFEPVLDGSRMRTEIFRYPLYGVPPDLPRGQVWKSRAELETSYLQGRGLELVWLDDPVDAFFVHVQGSSRFNLTDGSTMRLGFAGRNGHRYRSVGRQMMELGLLRGSASIAEIREWVRLHPGAGEMALQLNPSFIFFQELQIDDDKGPIGALQHPLTAMRSIAVDPGYTPLGAPVWIAMAGGAASINQLMVAQDTGSAINGAQRADIYFGSGVAAGEAAGRIHYSGQMLTLVPRATALRLTGRAN
ncbi:MAG: MltA domain-containing protein [Rhodobacteraceae bacterium]|nr:MltA domain-containing protein [Paracoccaceae bacterium]